MRHKHGYRKLSRTSAHRKALLKNLSIALIKKWENRDNSSKSPRA